MKKISLKCWKWERWQIILSVLVILVILFFFLFPKSPKSPTVISSIEEFETYLNKRTDDFNPPGMSFVAIKNNKIVYNKGFGWADSPRKIAATSDAIYHWFSITKIVTAIAILQLQEKGKLRLDDPVIQYLPYFKIQYPSPSSKIITIRDLLNHSSGLPDAGFKIIRWIHHDGELSVNQTDMIKKILPEYSKLAFEPNDHTQYTNIGYMVLGAIIEKVTYQTYEDYIRQNILIPLGMYHTDFVYTKAIEPDEAAGSHPLFNRYTPLIPFICWSYVREIYHKQIWLKRFYNDQTPPTGLIGPATDAARLVLAYLNNGELDGQRILSKESVTLMTHESYIKAKKDDPLVYRRQGIGWQIYRNSGRLVISHDGGGIGFSTKIELFPEENLGFILFTNNTICDCSEIINLAANLKW
jgi:CubicO group peptidase (beta-lactamase class C family)